MAFIFLLPPRRTALTLIQRSSLVTKVSNNPGTGRCHSALKVCSRQTDDKGVKQDITRVGFTWPLPPVIGNTCL